MARIYTLKAELNFQFDNHAELTSMRTAAASFASTHSGTYQIITNEDEDASSLAYTGTLVLEIPVTSRAVAASQMASIDDALSGLPDLYGRNGAHLRYNFVEIEDGN